MTTLPEPGAVLPVFPDRGRLLGFERGMGALLPPDPELPAGAAAPAWTIRGDDQIAAANVDGDGRSEIVVLGAQLTVGEV